MKPWEDQSLAPNGQTVSRNFNDWFAGSVVTEPSGEPLLVYHGTNRDFDAFNISRNGAVGQGAYFSPDPHTATSYAMRDGAYAGGRVMPVYLSLRNPFEVNEVEDPPSRKQLERSGYDGIIYRHSWNDGSKSVEYVVFHPEQVKSAIGNCGLYLKQSPCLTDHEAAVQLEMAQRARQMVQPALARCAP